MSFYRILSVYKKRYMSKYNYNLAHEGEHFNIKMQLSKGMDCGMPSFQTPSDVFGDRPFLSASASHQNISLQKTITA